MSLMPSMVLATAWNVLGYDGDCPIHLTTSYIVKALTCGLDGRGIFVDDMLLTEGLHNPTAEWMRLIKGRKQDTDMMNDRYIYLHYKYYSNGLTEAQSLKLKSDAQAYFPMQDSDVHGHGIFTYMPAACDVSNQTADVSWQQVLPPIDPNSYL